MKFVIVFQSVRPPKEGKSDTSKGVASKGVSEARLREGNRP